MLVRKRRKAVKPAARQSTWSAMMRHLLSV